MTNMRYSAIEVGRVLRYMSKYHPKAFKYADRLFSEAPQSLDYQFWLSDYVGALRILRLASFDGYIQKEEGIMSRRKTTSSTTYGTRPTTQIGEWLGFVDVKLSKDDRDRALSWNESDFGDELADLLSSNYKVTLTWDVRTETFLVSISCYSDTSVNFKRTLTTRFVTAIGALRMAVYKHVIVLDEQWVSDESKDANLG